MRRTARRPLAAGRLNPAVVLRFGVGLPVMGSIYLAIAVNPLASAFSIVTLLSYLSLYTPLKRKSPLCTLVGAFPGAVPALIGWAAASSKLSPQGVDSICDPFLWQFPHSWLSHGCTARTMIVPGTACCLDARREIVS
jgi:heme o synthase